MPDKYDIYVIKSMTPINPKPSKASEPKGNLMLKYLTPKRRKALYALAMALGAASIAFGVISPDALDNLTANLDKVTELALVLTGLLAALNVPSDE
jgi:hypothetical protein